MRPSSAALGARIDRYRFVPTLPMEMLGPKMMADRLDWLSFELCEMSSSLASVITTLTELLM